MTGTDRALFDALGSLTFLVLGMLLTWRTVVGAIDMYRTSELTPTLSFPRWITFPFDIACLLVLVLVTAYTLAQDLAQVRAARPERN